MDTRRALLVDGNDDFLDGVCTLLTGIPELRIVGRAHSGREAIERIPELAPDLVLVNVTLVDMSGFQAVRLLKNLRPTPKVLLLTFHPSGAATSAALAAGADGCLDTIDVAQRLVPVLEPLLWPDLERKTGSGKPGVQIK